MQNLIYINEPPLLFNYNQPMIDPRDGLSLFGPLDKAKPEGIRWAAIGPQDSIIRIKKYIRKIQQPIISGDDLIARPIFPGFEAAFHSKLECSPIIEINIDENELLRNVHCDDKYQRVFRTVSMYSEKIIHTKRTEDVNIDVWFVVIPDYVYTYCRPKSFIPTDIRIYTDRSLSLKMAESFDEKPFLYDEFNELAVEYEYDVNFHNQLKARLLKSFIPTQVIRESTIAYQDYKNKFGEPIRKLEKMESAIAWNISSALFYKAGGRPWKLGAAREGVCYIGLVFKQDERDKYPKTACCAAQMFLDSGDGVVFKGAVGPWYREKRGIFHLNRSSAKEVITMCIEAYAERKNGELPKELFVHGRVAFDDEEWAGFKEATEQKTNIVGIRIRPANYLKLYRFKDHPVLRGLAYIKDQREGYLWTKGMVPRLRTYPGREVPNPIFVDICRGEANIRTVMEDILALTKLNYNSCSFADGLPVTLKFANSVGEILTAGPAKKLEVPPLPFKFYI